MTTGEGGMITTDDPDLAERMRMLREHGMRVRYVHEMLGYNLRMTDLQAAIGLVQLKNLPVWNRARQAYADYLSENLSPLPAVRVPQVRPGATHVFHQYTIRTQQRDWMVEQLTKRGIGTGIYYPIPIHQQAVYHEYRIEGALPEAELASRQVLSLPVHPSLTSDELSEIAQIVNELAGAIELQAN
jgi:dTDP-4-amino-4,6-dideoxygalactose transaminase